MSAPVIELPWPPAVLSPNARSHWSATEDQALRDHIQAGLSQAEICAASGRTAGSIKNRAWRLGLLIARDWSSVQIETLKDMYLPGRKIDIDAICAATGKSKHAVHLKASRLGLGDGNRPQVEIPKVRARKFNSAAERSAHMSAIQKSIIAARGHPRHMAGKKHSESTKAAISQASVLMNAARTDEQRTEYLIKATKTKMRNGTLIRERPGASWKAAWREIGGIRKYYRSKWEANYAYYLEWLKQQGQIASWTHESKTFWFEGVKRGCVSYLPDFHVVENNGSEAYHEVKGWMDARSATKIRRMAKYHPTVKLIVIDSSSYTKLKKQVAGLVPGWEA
jgi:hypothetical protein